MDFVKIDAGNKADFSSVLPEEYIKKWEYIFRLLQKYFSIVNAIIMKQEPTILLIVKGIDIGIQKE